MEFIKDLGLKFKTYGKRKDRYGLFLCPECEEEREYKISYIRKVRPTCCGECIRRKKLEAPIDTTDL